VTLAHEVEEPARGADHHVHGRAQGLDLGLIGTAAVDGEHPRAAGAPRRPQIASDLDGQFPGRHHDQSARRERAPVFGLAEPLQQGDAERQRLAGSGACLADDVVAGEGDREGQRLDRERGGDSRRRQRVADRAAYTEVAEGGAIRWVGGVGVWVEGVGVWVGGAVVVGFPGGLYLCCQGFQLPSVARGMALH
jgi:hypothetical protein